MISAPETHGPSSGSNATKNLGAYRIGIAGIILSPLLQSLILLVMFIPDVLSEAREEPGKDPHAFKLVKTA